MGHSPAGDDGDAFGPSGDDFSDHLPEFLTPPGGVGSGGK